MTSRQSHAQCSLEEHTLVKFESNSNNFDLAPLNINIKISMGFVHKGPINNIPALVQIMACWHGCITDEYMPHSASMS